ncbi:MAG TPA: DUF6491 family protein [Woeseiaceae bacterium]|jgi:hypothetical protein|nr:DUF6491 family protein [Woeseiaceae bacterium]
MGAARNAVYMVSVALLFVAGCAASPLDEQRRLEQEADIAEILSYPLDPLEYGEPSRCLYDAAYRSYRVLDGQHMLFKGMKNRLWVNTLRSRCPGLRPNDTLVVKKFGGTKVCEFDKFRVAEWFGHHPLESSMGIECVFGDFQPISEQQLEEIEAVLNSR